MNNRIKKFLSNISIKRFIIGIFVYFKNDIKALTKKDLFIYSLLNFACFILPSIFYSLFFDNYNYRIDLFFLFAFIPLSFFMACSKAWLNLSIFVTFTIMELIQFSHIFYFGTPITPFEIELIWKEKGEILESGLDSFPYFLIPMFSVLIPYITVSVLYLKKKKSKGSLIFSVVVLMMLSILPRKALQGDKRVINNLMPRNDNVSIFNSISSFSGFLFNRVLLNYGKDKQLKNYEPYQVKKNKIIPKDINIVVIIGESDNPSRMGLLGHKRSTTPNLEAMAKKDKNFVYGHALSSSVLTSVATTMFANIQREPDNIKHLVTQPTHLFKLAKQNDFKTIYISAQDIPTANGFAPNFIDIFHTREYAPLDDVKKGDFVILDKLNEFNTQFTDRNFIILHQRNLHTPYEKRYKNFKQFEKYISAPSASWEERKRDSYDNAMLVNDYFISEVVKFFSKGNKQTYIFWIPDHSELLGEDGLWGHSIVNINVAKIPFVFTLLNKNDDKFVKRLRSTFLPTHYELGKMIAELLGYKIINPNEKENIFYVNGNIMNGDAGWFEIDKSNNQFKYTKHNP